MSRNYKTKPNKVRMVMRYEKKYWVKSLLWKEIQRLLEESNKISKELLEKSDKGTFDYTGPM